MNKKISYILLATTMLFNVDSFYDAQSREKLEATLRFTGSHAYYYVDNSVYQTDWQDDIQELAKEFDDKIYPITTDKYGTEWNPGIDGDERITVLITPMSKEAGGYFNPADEFSEQGNNREMIYLNSEKIQDPLAPSFLAHEFQHLINFYQKKKLRLLDEEIWLNEALSEYAPTAVGYDGYLESRINRFIEDPSNSLIQWSNSPYDYAAASIFMHYLVEQKGEEALNKILTKNTIGIDAVDDFQEIFTNWVIANYLDDCSVGNKYCYQNLDFKIRPTASYALFPISSLSVGVHTNALSPHWYKISGLSSEGKVLKLKFNSESEFTVPLIISNKYSHETIEFLEKETYIADFGREINSITLAPFSNQETNFSFVASLVDEAPLEFIETKAEAGLEPESEPELTKELTQEEVKHQLRQQISALQIKVLELQKELLLVKIQELKQRIAEILAQRNDQIAKR